MKSGESIFYILFTTTFLLVSCLGVLAKGMPSEPIIIGGLNPVEFDHGLHRSLGVPCGECHHDANHKMRSDKEIYAIENTEELHCKNCHNKDFASTYLQSRKEIFHVNCRVCHAVGVNGVRGPRKCKACHINAK